RSVRSAGSPPSGRRLRRRSAPRTCRICGHACGSIPRVKSSFSKKRRRSSAERRFVAVSQRATWCGRPRSAREAAFLRLEKRPAMNSETPNGTERSIDGRQRVYYGGYWIKAYQVPADTLLEKRRLIAGLAQ